MTIDITKEPPVDIFRNRGTFRLLALASLALSVCGILLATFAIFSDTPQGKTIETISFSLFVGPALVFFYFGEKLQDYKNLSSEQEKELTDLDLRHPAIHTYCALVAKAGRKLIMAEFEACQEWANDAK